MKSKAWIIAEGALYGIISGGTPWVALLEGEKDLTYRLIGAASVASIIAAATAIKAFMSQAMQGQEPSK
jgi:hypothetical protein